MYTFLYHDAWVDERYHHSIYSPYTLAQPFIFPYTLGCMVARTTNALAVANDPQLSGKRWLIESWYKSAVPWASVGVWVCTLRVVICIPLGFALGNAYNYTQGTNPIHLRSPWYIYICFHDVWGLLILISVIFTLHCIIIHSVNYFLYTFIY